MKRVVGMLAVLALVAGVAFAESRVIEGTVEQIADDGSFIMVDGQKIVTDQATVEDFFIEQGDEVSVTTDDADGALKLVDLDYVFPEIVEEETAAPAAE
jgi:hypothetical protein